MKIRAKPSMLGLAYAVLKAHDVIPKILDFFLSHLGTEAPHGKSDCGGLTMTGASHKVTAIQRIYADGGYSEAVGMVLLEIYSETPRGLEHL
ncbi:MAG: hypothetical protein ACK5RO_08075, partial [Pseudobdellovibrionaceae bacterium]